MKAAFRRRQDDDCGGPSRRLRALACALGMAVGASTVCLAADEAKGTITYQSKSGPIVVAVKHAYLVKGPDVVSGKTIRRIVLSVEDVGSKLRACNNMMCSDGGIGEGMTVDMDVGPRLNYWFVANDQKVQYSGTADPVSLKLTTDTPQRVAGKWHVDDHAAGGRVWHRYASPPGLWRPLENHRGHRGAWLFRGF